MRKDDANFLASALQVYACYQLSLFDAENSQFLVERGFMEAVMPVDAMTNLKFSSHLSIQLSGARALLLQCGQPGSGDEETALIPVVANVRRFIEQDGIKTIHQAMRAAISFFVGWNASTILWPHCRHSGQDIVASATGTTRMPLVLRL